MVKIDMLSQSNYIVKYAFDKGYRVKNGQIVNPSGRILSPSRDTSGYFSITMRIKYDDRFIFRRLMLHKLAAYQKYGARLFESGIVVRHRDGNVLNLKSNNILIGTVSQNIMDRDPLLRQQHASHAAKFVKKYSDDMIIIIRKDRADGMSYNVLSRRHNIPKSTLWYLINKRKD